MTETEKENAGTLLEIVMLLNEKLIKENNQLREALENKS